MCGAPKQGAGLAGVDLDTQTVIHGSVWHDGAPVAGEDFELAQVHLAADFLRRGAGVARRPFVRLRSP